LFGGGAGDGDDGNVVLDETRRVPTELPLLLLLLCAAAATTTATVLDQVFT